MSLRLKRLRGLLTRNADVDYPSFWARVDKIQLFSTVILRIELPIDMANVDGCEKAVVVQEVSVGFADHFANLLDLLSAHAEMVKPAVFSQHLIHRAGVDLIDSPESDDISSISLNQTNEFARLDPVPPCYTRAECVEVGSVQSDDRFTKCQQWHVTYAAVQVEVRTGVVEFEPGFVNRALRRNAAQVAEQLLFVQASVRFNGVGAIFKTANPARAFEIHSSYSNSFVRGNDN